LAPDVEITTGPLGQGFGNGVGMATAEANLAARYNRDDCRVIDHFTYGIVSDGDLMEGIASEAASLAGHLQLGKLIYLYDDNQITLSAGTDMTFTEGRARRFDAYGWHTQALPDGNDLVALGRALDAARAENRRPSLILVRTHIGYGSPNKQDTFEAHGSPLGEEEVRLTKRNLGWPEQPAFHIPEEASAHFREAVARGKKSGQAWHDRFSAYEAKFPELAAELLQLMQDRRDDGADVAARREDWDIDIPQFPADAKGMATRVASGKVMNAIAAHLPALITAWRRMGAPCHSARLSWCFPTICVRRSAWPH
jgi:transketolase